MTIAMFSPLIWKTDNVTGDRDKLNDQLEFETRLQVWVNG